MRGAPISIAVVIPVSSTMYGGIDRPGSTSVANSPTTSPPRTFTAPISVIASVSALPPVVSRSTTTKVVSCNGVSSSSKLSSRSWTLARPTDSPLTVRRLGGSCRCLSLGSRSTAGIPG